MDGGVGGGSSWSPQEASSSSRISQTDKCVLSMSIKDREAGRPEPGHGPREGWVYGLLAVLFIIIVSTTAGGAKDRPPLLLRYPSLLQEILYTCTYRCRAGGTFFIYKNVREHSTGGYPFSPRSSRHGGPYIFTLELTLST